MDILGLQCNHWNASTKQTLSQMDKIKFRPLTIKEGGVYSPRVVTTIDLPETSPPIDIQDLEYVLLGLSLGSFDFVSANPRKALEEIKSRFALFDNPAAITSILAGHPDFANLNEVQRRLKLAEHLQVDRIKETVRELRNRFGQADIRSLNDLLALKGLFGGDVPAATYSDYVSDQQETTKRAVLSEEYASLKESFGLCEVTYVEEVSLVSSCIGIINGVNKFYEPGFVPHFEPLWDSEGRRDRFHAIVYPFKTEGILFEMDRLKLVSFLREQGRAPEIHNSDEAAAYLLGISKTSPAYGMVDTLLHSISHALLRKASLRTGLEGDSLGELLFPAAGAFFVFSRSTVNTGGLGFAFENSLKLWLNDAQDGLDACTFDPICIHERGACFACLYVPEHVCVRFNQSLDRDAFVGRHRFKSRFW